MAKIKFTKGELKKQRDALKQYRRYLPTLQLKKQQLQMEILKQLAIYEEKRLKSDEHKKEVLGWAGLLSEDGFIKREWIAPKKIVTSTKNIAGVDLDIFENAEFAIADYDLFLVPMWVDGAIESLKLLVCLREEMKILKKGVDALRRELRTTTQRVNLFEKIKIPEAEETIRLIKIYLGDQMANAVGRSKIAKKKIEFAEALS